MELLKNKIWLLSFVLIALALYPVQRYLVKNDTLKKESLANVTLGLHNYAINQPNHSLTLPSYLGEISGLSLSRDDSTLLTIQDEVGQLFFVHKGSGAIVEKIKFSGNDDYEGIELVGDQIYITNNKGDVYTFPYPMEGVSLPEKATKQKTYLNSDDNIEGLGYDADLHSLLLASKDTRSKGSTKRHIYRYDIASSTLDTNILYTLESDRILKKLDRKKKSTVFSPSALAVHPKTKQIYIVSSPASSIIILSPKGQLLEAVELDRAVHRQPEGIVFDQDGTLYISNEGRDGLGKIHLFNPRKN